MNDERNGDRGAHAPVTEVELMELPDGVPIRVRFLSEVDGIITHWTPQKSKPCAGEGRCQKKFHDCPRIWKGYAAVHELVTGANPHWRVAVLEVTERLYHYLGEEVLRGSVWNIIRRKGRRNKEEVFGELVGAADPRLLPANVDYRRVANRIYRGLPIEWGQKPFLQAAQVFPVEPAQPVAVIEEPEEALTPRVYYESDMMGKKMKEELRAAGRLLPGKRPTTGGVQ